MVFPLFSVDASWDSGKFGRLVNHSKKKPNCEVKVYEVLFSINQHFAGVWEKGIPHKFKDFKFGHRLTTQGGDGARGASLDFGGSP